MNRRQFVRVAATTLGAAPLAAAVLQVAVSEAQSSPQAASGDLAPMQEHRLARQNYRPGAPQRAVVGRGKVVAGTIRSTRGGAPIANAKVEFWLNTTDLGGDQGELNPANQGFVMTDSQGRFRFETDPPARVWASAAPHFHTRVTAEGHGEFYYRHVTDQSLPAEDVSVVLQAA